MEKDDRRDEESDAAKRSILERPRDHRDARGVPAVLGGVGGGEEGADGRGASLMEVGSGERRVQAEARA